MNAKIVAMHKMPVVPFPFVQKFGLILMHFKQSFQCHFCFQALADKNALFAIGHLSSFPFLCVTTQKGHKK